MRFRLLATASFAFLFGCAAKAPPAVSAPPSETNRAPTPDAGTPAALSVLPDRPMPPLSAMPSPNVAQSARASVTPEDPLKKRVMKPSGQPIRVTLDEKGPASTSRIRLEAGRCYRATATAAAEALSVVLVLRDSGGAKITESPVLRLPVEGTVCATVADEAELLISVGRGKGDVTVKWESD